MKKTITSTLKELVAFIDKRPYSYMRARPYYKVGRTIISYAPVPHYSDPLKEFLPRGDVEGWINELPLGACIYVDTIIQEEKYSSEKFEKIDSNQFIYSMKKTRNARAIDEAFPIF